MARIKIAKTLVLGALLCVSLFAPITRLAQAAEPAVADSAAGAGCHGPGRCRSADGRLGRRLLLGHGSGVRACGRRHQRTVRLCGREKETAHYETVSSGPTGHAESVADVRPLPGQLRRAAEGLFPVADDPTELDSRAPTGHHIAPPSSIPMTNRIASPTPISRSSVRQCLQRPIVTEVEPLSGFYPAEDYHQHYADDTSELPLHCR